MVTTRCDDLTIRRASSKSRPGQLAVEVLEQRIVPALTYIYSPVGGSVSWGAAANWTTIDEHGVFGPATTPPQAADSVIIHGNHNVRVDVPAVINRIRLGDAPGAGFTGTLYLDNTLTVFGHGQSYFYTGTIDMGVAPGRPGGDLFVSGHAQLNWMGGAILAPLFVDGALPRTLTVDSFASLNVSGNVTQLDARLKVGSTHASPGTLTIEGMTNEITLGPRADLDVGPGGTVHLKQQNAIGNDADTRGSLRLVANNTNTVTISGQLRRAGEGLVLVDLPIVLEPWAQGQGAVVPTLAVDTGSIRVTGNAGTPSVVNNGGDLVLSTSSFVPEAPQFVTNYTSFQTTNGYSQSTGSIKSTGSTDGFKEVNIHSNMSILGGDVRFWVDGVTSADELADIVLRTGNWVQGGGTIHMGVWYEDDGINPPIAARTGLLCQAGTILTTQTTLSLSTVTQTNPPPHGTTFGLFAAPRVQGRDTVNLAFAAIQGLLTDWGHWDTNETQPPDPLEVWVIVANRSI